MYYNSFLTETLFQLCHDAGFLGLDFCLVGLGLLFFVCVSTVSFHSFIVYLEIWALK